MFFSENSTGLFSSYLFGVQFSPEKKDLVLILFVHHSYLHCRLNFSSSILSFIFLLIETVVKNNYQKALVLPNSGLIACIMYISRDILMVYK